MKSSSVRQWLFAFLLGGIVGGFGVLAAGLGGDDDPEETAGEGGSVTAVATRVAPRGGDAPSLDSARSDAQLAADLEQARFESSWGRVQAVAEVLRQRKRDDRAAAPVQSQLAKAREASLLKMDHQYRKRAFLLELAKRDNPATRALSEGTAKQQLRKLTDLFEAPLVRSEDVVVRRDAAYLLARLKQEAGRDLLLRALEDPDPKRADLAAEALGRADDAQANQALLELVARNPDPKLRARAVSGLTYSLGGSSDGSIVAGLSRAARDDRNLRVRTLSIAALARADLARDVGARSTIAQLLENETEQKPVRVACVAALRAHRAIARALPKPLIEALQRVVDKASGSLRILAIRVVGEAGGAESLAPLEAALAATRAPRERSALEGALRAVRKRAVKAQ